MQCSCSWVHIYYWCCCWFCCFSFLGCCCYCCCCWAWGENCVSLPRWHPFPLHTCLALSLPLAAHPIDSLLATRLMTTHSFWRSSVVGRVACRTGRTNQHKQVSQDQFCKAARVAMHSWYFSRRCMACRAKEWQWCGGGNGWPQAGTECVYFEPGRPLYLALGLSARLRE